jgi:hypothetical protein
VVELGVGGTNKCRRSTDGGVTWASSPLSSSGQWTSCLGMNGLLMVTSQVSLTGCKSVDGGASWTAATYPATGLELQYISTTICIGRDSSSRTWLSTNGGTSWTDISAKLPGAPAWAARVFRGRLIVSLWADTDKLYVSQDSGTTFRTVTLPFVARRAAFAVVGQVIYAFHDASPFGWAYSTDGEQWVQGSGAFTVYPLVSDPLPGSSTILPALNSSANYTRIPLLATSADTGAARVMCSFPGALDIEAVLPVRKSTAQGVTYAAYATPGYLQLPATSDRVVTDYSGAVMTFGIRRVDNVDVSTEWTYAWTTEHLTPASGTGSVATITAMDSAELRGYINVIASKPGEADITGRLDVVKLLGATDSGPRIGAAYAPVSTTSTRLELVFKTDGRVQVKEGAGSFRDLTTWAGAVQASNSSYWMWVEPEAGTHALLSGTTSTWLAMTSDRAYVLEDVASGMHLFRAAIFFAEDASGTNMVEGSFSMRLMVP